MNTSPSNIAPITIGLVQMAMTNEPSENLSKALTLIRKAAGRGAQIVCLPELFRSPYFCVHERSERDYVEEVNGEVYGALSSITAELQITLVAGSIYERNGEKRFNTSLIFDRTGSLLGTYRKVHIPHDPGFFEQHYFEPGDLGYRVFTSKIGSLDVKIGVLICYDQWFPEAARALALEGAQIIFYPTAIATVDGIDQVEGSWQHAWRTVQCGHAVANNVVVCAANRVGREGASTFWGSSFICDAFGRVLAEGSNREEVITAEVSLEHNRHVRESWRFFYERRPDTYRKLCEVSGGEKP